MNQSSNNSDRHPRDDRDPQIKTIGELKKGAKADVLVSRINLGLFQLVVIATIPEEGTNSAPWYWKFRIRNNVDDQQL